MAKKQVTVNEEMIRGIMAGDIPNYGKDISVDDVITTDESDGNECEADNPGPVTVEKSTGKPKKPKGRHGFVPQRVPFGRKCSAKAAGLYRYRQLSAYTEILIGCSPQNQYVEIH